jgi:hypothetical protein
MKLPREGTRARALVDRLIENAEQGAQTTYSDAKSAYDNKDPAYNFKEFGPRSHSGMNVSRLLRKYATRVSRGVYTLKKEINMSNPNRLFQPGDRVELYRLTPGSTIQNRRNPETNANFKIGDQATVERADIKITEFADSEFHESRQWLTLKGMGTPGGWASQNWRLVQAGPQNDKGSPEIRDMAWRLPDIDVISKEEVAKSFMESLRTDSVVKVSVSTEVIEQQKHRIKQLEEELDSMTERATFLMDKSAEWDGLLGQAREMLERIQYSEVGQVFSGCSDLDSFLQNLQQNVRNA